MLFLEFFHGPPGGEEPISDYSETVKDISSEKTRQLEDSIS